MRERLWWAGVWLRRRPERFAVWLAWKLPHVLVRWCYYRVIAHATSGQWGNECPDDVSVMDAAGRWEVGS